VKSSWSHKPASLRSYGRVSHKPHRAEQREVLVVISVEANRFRTSDGNVVNDTSPISPMPRVLCDRSTGSLQVWHGEPTLKTAMPTVNSMPERAPPARVQGRSARRLRRHHAATGACRAIGRRTPGTHENGIAQRKV
jgi:hypothetical protein